MDVTKIVFRADLAQCDLFANTLPNDKEKNAFTTMVFILDLTYIAPALVVTTSSIMSVVLLTKRNENVQQRELQQSRNRATVTILLFALLYGVCNIPIVVTYILMSYSLVNDDMQWSVVFEFIRV